jgi:single-strand DNA-binding protein
MSGSLNRATLIGNLGQDPEVRRTNDGRPVVNLSLATSESWTDKRTGERREKTEWHRIVIFNEGLCEIAEKYLKKGAKVFIEGAIQTRKWTDKDNIERYSTEIVLQAFGGQIKMLDRAERNSGGDRGGSSDHSQSDFGATGSSGGARRPAMAGGGDRGMDDEIPF